MPVHVDEELVMSSKFKELLCLFAVSPPSLQLLATHSIRGAILDSIAEKKKALPSSANIKAAANGIDLPEKLKGYLLVP